MNNQDETDLYAILLALHYQLQPISRALDSIDQATSKGDPVWHPGHWTAAVGNARFSLENVRDTITRIIEVNKHKAGFNPEQWN